MTLVRGRPAGCLLHDVHFFPFVVRQTVRVCSAHGASSGERSSEIRQQDNSQISCAYCSNLAGQLGVESKVDLGVCWNGKKGRGKCIVEVMWC